MSNLALDSLLTEADFEEIGRSFYLLQQIDASQGLLDFAAKPKQCQKGFACKSSCISKTRECKSPLAGQAKDYAGWLKLQIAAGAKLSSSQQADAQSQGLTSQPATKTKKTKTAAITPPKSPPLPTTSTTHSLADAVEKGDFAKAMDHAVDIYNRAKQAGGSDFYFGVQQGGNAGEGEKVDYILSQLYKDRGYDGKPTVVTSADIDAYIKAGETPMFRAIGSTPARFQQHFDAFKTGDYFAGQGIYGNGTYVGYAKNTKTSQRKAYDGAESYGSGMMRMTLDKDAVIVKQTIAAKEVRDTRDKFTKWADQERQRLVADVKKKIAAAPAPDPVAARKAAAAQVKTDLANDYDMQPKGKGLFSGPFFQTVTLRPKNVLNNKPITLGETTLSGSDHQATDPSGQVIGLFPTAAKARKALLDLHLDRETDKALLTNTAASQFQKEIDDFDDRVRRTEAVLFGDSGGSHSKKNNGVSGRFAVIRGYDAIALDDSYNTSYMSLLNRTKARVQDTDNMGNRP